MKIVKRTALWVGIGAIVLVVGEIGYAILLGGPHLEVIREHGGVHVQGRFLGEYVLGFERVQIRDLSSGTVVCDLEGRTNSDLGLRGGRNTPTTMYGSNGKAFAPQPGSGADFDLQPGRPYELTAWGNNGWGRINASSISFTL